MGLLDDLLAGMAGQSAGASQPRAGAQAPQSGGNMSQIMIALLPIVLSMLAQNRGQAPASAGAGRTGGGGGLGDLLGSLLGGGSGGGGLGDLLSQFQKAGFGAEADSWVSRGQNRPLPPGGLDKVFGRDVLAQIAQEAGVSEADASSGLSQLLPEVVDHVTPDGKVPDFGALSASVDQLARRYRLG